MPKSKRDKQGAPGCVAGVLCLCGSDFVPRAAGALLERLRIVFLTGWCVALPPLSVADTDGQERAAAEEQADRADSG